MTTAPPGATLASGDMGNDMPAPGEGGLPDPGRRQRAADAAAARRMRAAVRPAVQRDLKPMTNSLIFDSDDFTCERRDRVAVLRLKPGALSMLTNLDSRADYYAVATLIEDSDDLLGLVVLNTSDYPGDTEYRAFIAGITAVDEDSLKGRRLRLSIKENSLAMASLQAASFRKPLVAGFQGTITAAFLGLSLGFDFRLATPDTVFEFPMASLGFPLGGAICLYLPRYVGQQRAAEILLSGAPIAAGRAAADGFVNEVVPENRLEERCCAMVARVAALPAHAIAATRALLHPDPADLRRHLDRAFDTTHAALAQINREHARRPPNP